MKDDDTEDDDLIRLIVSHSEVRIHSEKNYDDGATNTTTKIIIIMIIIMMYLVKSLKGYFILTSYIQKMTQSHWSSIHIAPEIALFSIEY